MFSETIKTYGRVELILDYLDGKQEIIRFPNTILQTGREALASALANNIGGTFNFFISNMIFGDGGTAGGSVKFVNTNRNGLFGVTRSNKPVISSVDPNVLSQVVLTSVVPFAEANGYALSEMALVMNTGDLYSMTTFKDVTKTEQLQLTVNWSLSFV